MPLADASLVDGHLAATFGLDPDDLWAPGVHVTAHVAPSLVGWHGVVAFARGRRTLVSVPPELVLVSEGLRRLTPDGEGDHLAEPLREVYGGEVYGSEVHRGDVRVIGPSRCGFADAVLELAPHRSARVDVVDPADLEPFAEAVGAADWSGAGFDRSPARVFAVRDGDGAIAAAANLRCWRAGADDVGVCVHPERRRQGFGCVAAHAALSAAVGEHGIARYRALLTDAGSLRIADRIGVVGYGMQYAVVPPTADEVPSAP